MVKSEHLWLTAVFVSVAAFPAAASAGPASVSVVRQDGELVLYDAATHGLDVLSNGNTSKRDFRPVPKIVNKAGQTYVEFSYSGKGGRARSLIRYERLPAPPAGKRYGGVKLTIDYDGTDYAKVDAMAHFHDSSYVGQRPLTLGPGENEYRFSGGFRRAKWPIAWDKLDWLQLSVRSLSSEGNPIKWRLRRMVMLEKDSKRKFRDLRITRAGGPRPLAGKALLVKGDVKVVAVRRAGNRDKEGTGCFQVDCVLRGFRPGTYRARCRLGQGETEPQQEETVAVAAGPETKKTFTLPSAPNKNGLYTFQLVLMNERNEARSWTVEFLNSLQTPDLFGKRLLSPRPKQIAWGQGAFAARRHAELFLARDATARTVKTAEIFRKKYHAHTGVSLATKRFDALGSRRGIMLRIAPSAAFKGAASRLKRDGYCLNVGPERVVITGADERGLYYGMRTFFQLMKNDFKIQAHMPVPCVEILDWPDLPNRVVMAGHGAAWHYWTYGERRGIEYLIDWADRFVAQNKATMLWIDLSRAVIYERRPKVNGKRKLYTLDQIREFGGYCKDNFIDVCPAWQVGGHANWWLLGPHPNLRERGYNNQSDVTHPEHNKVVFDCMLDVIEALGCKYASPKGDEWWGGGRKKGEKQEEVVRGLTKAERYLDFHLKCHAFLKSKGVRMLMFDDEVSPYHNGQKDGIYKLIDRFPKDIIFCNWGYQESMKWYKERGFEVWRTPNGSGGLPSECVQYVNGVGCIIYGLGTDGGGRHDHYNSMKSTYSSCRAADLGWNAYDYPGDEPGRAVSMRNLFALKPNGQAGPRSTPLDLTGSFTHSFNQYLQEVKPEKYDDAPVPVRLKSGVRNIAHVPMRLAGTAGKDCIILREKDEGVAIPVSGRYASLVFLHTSFINDFKDKRSKPGMGRKWPYGYPVGRYVVHYADGATATLPVRLSADIRRFDTSSKNRATNNNRYVYVVEDCDYDPVHLYQWEWVNPHPHKPIEKVVVEHENKLDVSMIVFSITGRELWEGAMGKVGSRKSGIGS